MVKLFVQVAKNGHAYEEGHPELKARVERRFARSSSVSCKNLDMNPAHRLAALLVAAVVIVVVLVAGPSPLHAAETRRPNFILMFTDDQRYDAMSVVQAEQGEHGRFPSFKTPNMDRIVRRACGSATRSSSIRCAPRAASIS